METRFRWTIPITYSYQDFDEIQARADEITDDLRKQGKYSGVGYTKEALEQATNERREVVKAFEHKNETIQAALRPDRV